MPTAEYVHPDPLTCFVPLGYRIRQIREARGLSQTELARRVKVHPNSMNRWERGKAAPSSIYLPPLAVALKVELRDFYVYRGEADIDPPGKATPGPKPKDAEYEEAKAYLEEKAPVPEVVRARPRHVHPSPVPEPVPLVRLPSAVGIGGDDHLLGLRPLPSALGGEPGADE